MHGKIFDEKRIKFDILLKDTKLTICPGFKCTLKEYSELLFTIQ
jgi:hypothetical protein